MDVAKLFEDVEAGEARHAHVRENDVERVTAREVEAFLATRGNEHRVACAAEHACNALAHAGVVIDYENPRHPWVPLTARLQAVKAGALSSIRSTGRRR